MRTEKPIHEIRSFCRSRIDGIHCGFLSTSDNVGFAQTVSKTFPTRRKFLGQKPVIFDVAAERGTKELSNNYLGRKTSNCVRSFYEKARVFNGPGNIWLLSNLVNFQLS